MLLSDVSIKRPVFATMMNLVLIVFGLFSFPRLAVDQMPEVDFPFVTVSAIYPGADPETIEQRVLKPLEDAVNSISGLDKLMSTAYPSLAQLVLQFKLEKNGDQAAQETRDKIFAAVQNLPTEVETPVVQKFDVGGAPILNIAVSANAEVSYEKLSDFAKNQVQTTLQRIDGVASVNPAGIREREVQIFVDRDRLAGFGLTPSDVIDSVKAQNLDVPAGKIQNDRNYWTLRVKGKLARGEEVARLPIMARNSTLRIGDVATVKDTIAEEKTAAFIGKVPTILMSLQKQAGTNTPAVAEAAKKALTQLATVAPKGVTLQIVTDNSKYIKGSIDSVKLDLVLGAALATFIVLLFLRNFWITVISAVALPTAVIATFAFLNSMHFTLNMMTTLALSLSIGILIDDAIIVVENIERHLAMGKNGAQAARDATAEIGLAVIATTATICAVFVPVAFMEGIIGRFFFQFGLTVAFAVAVSLFVAFTATPMLSSRLLKPHAAHAKAHGPLAAFSNMVERLLTGIESRYKRILAWCLDHRAITLSIGVATFIASIMLLRFVPVSFFPKEDKSQFNINYTLAEGTTLEETKKRAFEVVDALSKYPGIDKVVTALAATREAKPNKARFDVLLVDKADRAYTQDDIMNRVREDLSGKYGSNGSEFILGEESGGAGGGRTQPIQLIFKSDDWPGLVAYTDKVAAWIAKEIPGAVEVSTSKPKDQREFKIVIDPARAADLAVSTAQAGQILRALFEGDKISEIQEGGSSYDVRLRIADKDRVRPEDIAAVNITNRRGEQISLGSLATIQESNAPALIERFDGQRQIVVLSNFRGKDLNGATNKIQEYIKTSMPPQISLSLSGQVEIMKTSMIAMLKALGLAIVLVLMIMCAQYERYLAPMVILAALPLSLSGAFGSLLITGQVMSLYAMIGIILLMGLVTKNGILLIDFTLQRINEGVPVKQALYEAGPIRLRPILMTTFAAGGGMLPVAIGHGVGGEARSPMGVAVIGGLLMSTLLTLVVVPCLFSAVEGGRLKWQNRKGFRFGKAKDAAHTV